MMKKAIFCLAFLATALLSCEKEQTTSPNNYPDHQAYKYIVGKRLRRDKVEYMNFSTVTSTHIDGITIIDIDANGNWDEYPANYSEEDKIIVDYTGGTGTPATYVIEQVNSIKLVVYQPLSSSGGVNGARHTYAIIP